MVMRNRGHEVDPVEGTSSQKNIHRFFPRAAQGPHKVRTRSTLAGSSQRPIWLKLGGNVDKTLSRKRGSQESLRMYGFPSLFRDFFGGLGSVVSSESLNMHGFPYMFQDCFGGVGSVGSPESLKMHGFLCIGYDFFGAVGSPESLKM